MHMLATLRARIVLAFSLCGLCALAGCSNGRGSVAESGEAQQPPPPTSNTFNVRGNVSGLAGSGLVLQLNGANDTEIDGNGAFAFGVGLPNETAYVVTVAQQPANPAQVCTPQQASGTINGAHVTNVSIVCSTQSFAVGGSVSGLRGSGLVLRRNGEEDLSIASNGAFTFETAQASGTTYEITVATQPTNPSQTCTIANATGTVGSGDARSVTVTCATNTYSVGGVVSGLSGGRVVLANSGDTVEIESNGAFAFPTPVASGGNYDVTVRTQPGVPPQTCTVTNGRGTVTTGAVDDIEVSCSISTFSVGGTLSGLAGTGLLLQNNGGDDLQPRADGPFEFAVAVQSGRPYNVTVAAQPTGPAQECTVENGSGVIGAENVKNVRVRCVTTEFMIGGRVRGLAGAGLVLQNNGGDPLPIGANGPFTFGNSLPTGATYAITVAAQPAGPTQECSVANGSGTIGTANVSNVDVSCVTSRFPINVIVTGLEGFNLRVRLGPPETLTIHSNGTYTFPNPIESGRPYNVTIASQPIFPIQDCVVENGQGTVGGGPVNVRVTCS
jgi:hypothetical protein